MGGLSPSQHRAEHSADTDLMNTHPAWEYVHTHGNEVSRRFGNMSVDPANRWRDQDLTSEGRSLCPEPPPCNASFFYLFWASRRSESPKMLLLEGKGKEGPPGAGTTASGMPCSSFAGV